MHLFLLLSTTFSLSLKFRTIGNLSTMAATATSMSSSSVLTSSTFKPTNHLRENVGLNCFSSFSNRVGDVTLSTSKRPVVVQAVYSDSRSSGGGAFVRGFVLGGLIIGTLGCVYAPQINSALAGAYRKDLMRKLPKFIYDEEKALEKTRKVLDDKIKQLNDSIDAVSSQLRPEDEPNGVAGHPDEAEAAI